ncbi:LuxE/PaaK family acyltransferase [Catellatospora bangladeshensis]|uniref:Acyl-protein synthetase n=1 Tax=Catellatospora bangladeshensis TaxID=310355 RepID=A0A8J3NNX3_9ACTN|nr:acyl-protein synthetase [Catellatospora bangladeshensis]GIF85280.1 acyl-protein synthetase [Catellatospora bangladeshensis]
MTVFTLTQPEREARLLPELAELTEHHRAHSPEYARLLAALGHGPGTAYDTVADLPWLPVRLFKHHELRSIPAGDVFKVLTSSGTTGDVSRIYLDRDAAALQQRMLSVTMQTVIGAKRLPMLLVDTVSLFKNRSSFSARGAGVLGMMNFGRDHVFVLDEHDQPDLDAVKGFLAKHGDQPFLIFGFTFMAWQFLYELARDNGLDLSNGILIHSGGWKKLADRAVDNDEFRRRFAADTGLRRIHNFYGMVEQIGLTFLEGPDGGGLYCPDFSDVIVRDPHTWEPVPHGTPGVVEVISTLPRSYPGHVLLTEDRGVIHGVDDGAWPGKRFSILGRLPRAEARGCSDTFSEAKA